MTEVERQAATAN